MTKLNKDQNLPLLSVCIPVYNGKNFIMETIHSVFRQDYPNLEIIIQDNSSSDGSWEMIEQLGKRYPNVFVGRNESNLGMSSNWNYVINRAKGDYVILLSADDQLEPGFIQSCMEIFKEQQVDVVTTNHKYLRNNKKFRRKMCIKEGIYRNFTGRALLLNPFSINFTIFKKDILKLFKNKGRIFSSFMTCDYDLWIRFSLSGKKIYYISKPLGIYRIHDTNLSGQVGRLHCQTILTLLRHRKKLIKVCNLIYRFTLLRFMIRWLIQSNRITGGNKKIPLILFRELIRFS